MAILTLGLFGCSTMKESLILGVTSGAATGMIMGPVVAAESPRAKLGGALIGAVVGGVASYFVHQSLENRDSKVRKETLFNLDKYNVSRPVSSESSDYGVTSPGIETECFDTEIRGDKLVEAHCESTITGKPGWVQGGQRKKNARD